MKRIHHKGKKALLGVFVSLWLTILTAYKLSDSLGDRVNKIILLI